MIELGDPAEYEVTITALVPVTRTIRMTARGDGHASYVAEQEAQKDRETHEWIGPMGEHLDVPRDKITKFSATATLVA